MGKPAKDLTVGKKAQQVKTEVSRDRANINKPTRSYWTWDKCLLNRAERRTLKALGKK